jgi:hypothetical protein
VVDESVADQLLHSVVRIRATVGGKNVTGYGLIFARSGDTIWIATAAHVVFENFRNDNPGPAASISVQRRADSRLWPAEGPPERAFGVDIAFVPISMPRAQSGNNLWREPVVVASPDIGDAARIAATTDAIVFASSSARILKRESNGNLEFEGLRGQPGQSGAPVATSAGFIGIYVSGEGERVVPIQKIAEAAKLARRSWDLVDAPQKPMPVLVCANFRSITGMGKPTLNGPRGMSRFDEQGCAQSTSGLNLVVPPVEWSTCEPSQFAVPRVAKYVQPIHCTISPAGMWKSRDGFVQVSPVSDGVWKISGLEQSHHGALSGMLRGQIPDLFIDARAGLRGVVTGTLHLEPRRLSGDIVIAGVPYKLELTR